jgi:hypothetical protein
MLTVPQIAQPLVQLIAPAFARRATLQRFVLLMTASITALGRHSVSHLLWSVRSMLWGHASSFHRVFSHARWSLWPLAELLTRQVLERVPADAPVLIVGDDTVEGRPGEQVWGASVHRDPLASTRKLVRFRRGHKWVTLAVVLKLPLVSRLWALPVLSCLVCGPKTDQANGRTHHTVRRRIQQMLIRLMRWFPRRRFIFVGDWGASCNELAEFAAQHPQRLTVIARMRQDTCLHAPPKHQRRRGRGRPARKGKRLPSPQRQAQTAQAAGRLCTATVDWYGQRGPCPVQYVSDVALWYCKHRNAVLPIRWVCTINPETGNEDYFYCTDLQMPVEQIIQYFIGRWPIEVTYQEVRAHLGLQHTRHWCQKSVLRVAPCQFGLFTVVCLLYAWLCEQKQQSASPRLHETPCYHKDHVTFADALHAVRREIWQATLLRHWPQGQCLTTLPPDLREMLLDQLSAAA